MTKKSIITVCGLLGLVLFVVFIYSRQLGICPNYSYSDCASFLDDFALILFPVIPLLILSLITFKMRDEIYYVWWKFARIWIPLSMLAVFVSPSYENWMIPIEKGTVAFASSILFVIISLVLIVWQSIKERKSLS